MDAVPQTTNLGHSTSRPLDQAANDARKAKEAKREERRKRSSAMGFGEYFLTLNPKLRAASHEFGLGVSLLTLKTPKPQAVN